MSLDPATRRLAAVVVIGAILSMLDATVVGVGLATIARDLGAELATAQWVASGYLLALAAALPACGWLSRRFGAGRVWLLALAGFTLTSLLCALAPTLPLLIGARVLQGLAAGLLVPAGQTLLGQAVGPERLGRVMATLAAVVSLGPALGPILGGVLLEALSWPWLFLVNVPIGLLGLLAGLRIVPRGERAPTGRLDVLGLVLAAAGLSTLVQGITAWSWPSAAVGGVVLLAFAVRTLRSHHPLTDLRLFTDPAYAAAAVCTTLVGAVLFGSLLLFPLLFQLGQDTGVIATGLSMAGYGLGTAVIAPLAGRIIDRFDKGLVGLAGCLALVAVTVPFAVSDPGPVATQVLLVLRGIALAFGAFPATVAAYAAVRPEQLPDATTQVNALQRIGGAIGGALLATIVAAGGPGAFAHAFWWLTGMAGLAAVASAVLSARTRSAA